MHHELRNKKRGIARDETLKILARGEYGILSTTGHDNKPYGVPLSYASDDAAIYFHCATEGRKLRNIASNPQVSFCVTGETEVLPEQFSTRYESAIVSGRCEELFGDEKQSALEKLVMKYSAGFHAEGIAYIKAAWNATRAFKIVIGDICGKARY